MTGPDFGQGFLRLPLPLWKALFCRCPLTRRQLQLVCVIIRESWGWRTREGGVHLWTRPLTTRQFAEATGLRTDHLARDLEDLTRRGVLQQQDRRYHLVADPALWTSARSETPNTHSPALKPPAMDAESALPTLASKKAQNENRNVAGPTRRPLSPVGDNSPASPASADEKLLDVVLAFTGPVPARERLTLQRRIKEDGIATVWTELGPRLLTGRRRARERLHAFLHSRGRLTRW